MIRARRFVMILFSILLVVFSSIGYSIWKMRKDSNKIDTVSNNTISVEKEDKKGETVTKLRVEVWDRGNIPLEYGTVTNNQWTRYIQENFGNENNIEIEYVAISREQEIDKINALMAIRSAPDIILTYSTSVFNNFASQGGLADLSDAIKKYGPNIKTYLGSVFQYGQYEGTQYAVNAKRVLLDYTSHYIRKDWLDRIGYELKRNNDGFYHMSVEELETVLKEFKIRDLDETGEELYPFGMNGVNNQWRAICGLFDVFFDGTQITEEMRATIPYIQWPGFKDCMKWINKMYHAGMIDPYYATQADYIKMDEYIATGRTGYWTCDSWHGMEKGGVLDQLKQNYPQAEVVAFQLDNVHETQMNKVYAPNGLYAMVPSFSNNVEAAVKYMNWLADPINSTILAHGIEGEHYLIKEGIPVVINQEYNAKTRINVQDLNIFNTSFQEKEVQIKLSTRTIPNWEELRETAIRLNFVNPYSDFLLSKPNQMEMKYSDNLGEKIIELYVKSIMCLPEQFDTTYDVIMNEYMEAGGKKVEEEAKKIYKEMVENEKKIKENTSEQN